MGSREGALKVAAGKIGIPIEQYKKNIADGLKWCYKCRTWRQRSQFDVDKSRGDGRTAACIECRRVKIRKKRIGFPPSKLAQQQASSAISYEVKKGRMTRAADLPCRDCGGNADEYHHHLGYSRGHWLDAVPLCKSCHVKRHWE